MSEASRYVNRRVILNAASADGVGTAINVQDFKNIQLMIATGGSADCVIKVQGSLAQGETNICPVDFSASASSSNPWDYVACYDLNNPGSLITGSSGITVSGTDICKNLLVNVDGMVWLNVVVSSYSAGTVTATAVSFNNQ